MSIMKKYRRYWIASMLMILAFVVLTVWIYIAADAPQLGPFEYQVF